MKQLPTIPLLLKRLPLAVLLILVFAGGFLAGSSPLSKNGAALHDLVSAIPSSLDDYTSLLEKRTDSLLNQTSLHPQLLAELNQAVQDAQTTFFYPQDPVFSQVQSIAGKEPYQHLQEFLSGFEGLLYHLSLTSPEESAWRSDARIALLIQADEVLFVDLPQGEGSFSALIDHLESQEGAQVREQFAAYVLSFPSAS